MANRKITFAVDEYYHLYNRGNSKQEIFYDKHDRDHFLKLLYLCNSDRSFVARDIGRNYLEFDKGEPIVYIGAFCLMPNHFHILVKEKEENGIVRFMKKLSTAYVMYLNTRHKRTGGLFEGRFKSEHVDDDIYLKYIFSYIHLNPLKLIDNNWKENGLKDKSETEKYLKEYFHSSFPEYASGSPVRSPILNREAFPEYFPSSKEFLSEIEDWIEFTP